MVLLITIVIVAWVTLSGLILISVCMMSSLANQTELRDEDSWHRRLQIEDESSQDVPGQAVEHPTW